MLGRLMLLLMLVPALELYLLIQLGERIGGLATFAILLAAAVLGAALTRAQGLRMAREWQQALAAGTVPEDGVVSGALVLLGGVLLIIPGVLSDLVGVLLLVPFVRRPIARYIALRMQRAIEQGSIHVVRSSPVSRDPFARRSPFEGEVIDVIDVEGESVPSPRLERRLTQGQEPDSPAPKRSTER